MNKKKNILIIGTIVAIISIIITTYIILRTKVNKTSENNEEEVQLSGLQVNTSEDYKNINIMTEIPEDIGVIIPKDITTQIDEAAIVTTNAIGMKFQGNANITNSSINSENYTAIVIEDSGTVTMDASDIMSSGKGTSQDSNDLGGIVIQGSKDNIENIAKFTATNSMISIISTSTEFYSAPMFLIKNNKVEINLENTEITYGSDILLKTEGEGTEVTLNTKMQILEGNIETINGEIINLNLTGETNFVGAINLDNNAKEVNVNISANSLWLLTADTYVTSITVEDKNLNNILSGGNNIYYDSTNEKNAWMEGKTILLNDGGYLIPQ